MPQERITLEETLQAYTGNAARAGFSENRTGRIQAGMLADLVVMDRDLFQTEAKSLVDARVVMTVVDGVVAFERSEG